MRLSRHRLAGQTSGMDTGSDRRTKIVSSCCAVAGGLGAVACSLSMTLAALGIVGTAAAASGSVAGMAGMDSGTFGQPAASGPIVSFIRVLVGVGPPLLLISVAAGT